MLVRNLAVVAYVFYVMSCVAFFLMVGEVYGFRFGAVDIALELGRLALPIAVSAVIGGALWLFKRKDIRGYFFKIMILITPMGAGVIGFAAYLVWWSANKA